MKILIVDDIEMLRTVASMMIASIAPDAKLLTAESGNDAIRVIDKHKPEIVLCDYDMPDGNGGVVFKHLTSKYPETKFVLTSSWAISELKEFRGCKEALQISKPYTKDDLKVVLEKIFYNGNGK